MQLYGYLWILLGAVCIFNCYRLICLPGDEDMPPRNNLFYRVMKRKKKAESALSPEEALQYAKEQREQDKRAYNAQMQRRQQERTRKKKRGKHRK